MPSLFPVDIHNTVALELYRKTVKKWTTFIRIKNQTKFLQRCVSEQVIPKSFGLIKDRPFSGEAFADYQRSFLLDKVKESKYQSEECHLQLRHLRTQLQQVLPATSFEGAMRRAGEVASRRGAVHFNSLIDKLVRLCDESPWFLFNNRNNIQNLSNFHITKDQKVVLGYGLNFCIGPSKDYLTESLSSINSFNYYHPNIQVNFLKGYVAANYINDDINNSVLPLRYQKALDELRKNKRLKVMRADKGGAIVLMDNDDYKLKAYRLLDDETTYEKLSCIPSISSVQNKFNREVRKIANGVVNKDQRNLILDKISDKVPSLPYFYGIPKVHKEGCPLRPIVATCNSPQSKLSSWLAHYLSSYLGVFSPAHLLHSLDFVERMKSLGNRQGKMISLDVTALFTNVPLDFVLDNLFKKAEEGIFVPPVPIHSFLELIKLCVSTTTFTFDGHGFKQKFGVAMGSPLSPVLANLCMEFLESDYILNCPNNIKPLLWYHYVDDVFIIYQENEEYFNEFLLYVNNLIPSIKFTVEYETNNSIPFLDVLVQHDPVTHAFSFKVYRKPTNAEMYSSYRNFLVQSALPTFFLL